MPVHPEANLIQPATNFTEVQTWYIVNGEQCLQLRQRADDNLTPEFDSLPYSDGVVTARSDFGASGRYVTQGAWAVHDGGRPGQCKHGGCYWRAGSAPARHSGRSMLRVTRQGKAYKVMVKRVYNAQMPSVNHLVVIVPDVSGLNHQFAQDSRLDDHRISGLSALPVSTILMFTLEVWALLVNDEAAVIELPGLVTGGTWLRHASPQSGSLTAGSSRNVTVTLSSLGQAARDVYWSG